MRCLGATVVARFLSCMSMGAGAQAFEHGAAGGVPYIPAPQVVVEALREVAGSNSTRTS
ncbi:MAG: hypothetical protein ABIU95_11065 [Burkholderiales bacterium]